MRHTGIRARLAPVSRDQRGALRDGATDSTRQATDGMSAIDRLPGQLAPKPRRPTKNQDLHQPNSIKAGNSCAQPTEQHDNAESRFDTIGGRHPARHPRQRVLEFRAMRVAR